MCVCVCFRVSVDCYVSGFGIRAAPKQPDGDHAVEL